MNNIFDNDVFALEEKIFESSYDKQRIHTFFTMKDKIIYSETEHFGSSKKFEIKKSGERYLISSVTFFIELPFSESFVDDIEFAIIKNIKLIVGGQDIHTLTNDQIYMYSKINKIAGKRKNSFCITIPFYMNNVAPLSNDGIFLPFMSLVYHEVKLDFEYEKLSNLVKYGVVKNQNSTFKCNIMLKQVFLTNLEEKRFIESYQEYLVTLNQNIYKKINSKNYNLDLNEIGLCVKNFNFAFRGKTTCKYFNYLPICNNAKLNINNYLHFDKFGDSLIDENNIYKYSFELVNNTKQPTGSLNFSKISKINLKLDLNLNEEVELIFSAEHFNVVYVFSGLMGIKFALSKQNS